jgi:hypothetical protein
MELVISMTLSAIVFAAILSGFTFLGRNLTRLVNRQDQETKSRHAFYIFSKDISVATQVAAGSNTTLSLKLPVLGGGTSTVFYSFNSTAGALTRTDSVGSTVLLTDLTAFNFNYFNGAGIQLALTPDNQTPSGLSVVSVKEVELKFTSALGSSTSGVRSSYASVSPRLLLRNKALLQ